MLSQVNQFCHFIIILSNQNEIPRINIFAENVNLHFMRFCTENPYSKIVLTRTCFICQPIYNMFARHITTN